MEFTKEHMDFGGSVYFYDNVDRLPREKENTAIRFLSMICRSWTFERMTAKEKERFVQTVLDAVHYDRIKGAYNARWEILQNMYTAFLNALGYMDNPGDWRGERA